MTMNISEYQNKHLNFYLEHAIKDKAHSTSHVQRVCRTGYNLSLDIIDLGIKKGLIDRPPGKEWLHIVPAGLSRLSPEEFKKRYLGEFVPDDRETFLLDRLDRYYKNTEELNSKEALPLWRGFNTWCKFHGYTQAEINRAKMNKRFKDI